mmetsp:Transcript_9087/g.24542  ORF Transcript_9087/g.24542 Transcript_9087/m.24542 type:complete len:213 (+) Transcript_9087:653-1291(+)
MPHERLPYVLPLLLRHHGDQLPPALHHEHHQRESRHAAAPVPDRQPRLQSHLRRQLSLHPHLPLRLPLAAILAAQLHDSLHQAGVGSAQDLHGGAVLVGGLSQQRPVLLGIPDSQGIREIVAAVQEDEDEEDLMEFVFPRAKDADDGVESCVRIYGTTWHDIACTDAIDQTGPCESAEWFSLHGLAWFGTLRWLESLLRFENESPPSCGSYH